MKIRPNKKWLVYKSISQFLISGVTAVIPLIVAIFFYGLMQKMERKSTPEDSLILFYVYAISFIFIFIFSLLKEYFYVGKSYVSAGDKGVEIYKSFLGQNKNSIPYINIDSLEVNQEIAEKMLGLGTLYIYTKKNEENFELRGFLYSEASAFADKTINEYKIGMKRVR